MRNMTEEEKLRLEVLQRHAQLAQARFNLRLVELRSKYGKLNPSDDELSEEELREMTAARLGADVAKAKHELKFLELQEACNVPPWAKPGADGSWKNPETGKGVIDV